MPTPLPQLLTRVKRQPLLRSAAEAALAARHVPPVPAHALVGVDEAEHVVLVCSRRGQDGFHAETHSQETALALELAARGRPFAMTDDASAIFGKRVAWARPAGFLQPELWDHARQVRDWVAGLESQGNEVLCSSAEAAFWENKAHMHRELDRVGAATPRTVVVTAAEREDPPVDWSPVLVKEEHAAGSAGVHHFATVDDARRFIAAHPFRPGESLIAQEVVEGATRDLRLTMVGDRVIGSATYWRVKAPERVAAAEWTSTATTYGSTVVHEAPPEGAVRAAADAMRALGLRTAGIDLMWEGDDVSGTPLMLELSPFYQPNPPKPARYADRSYKAFKAARFARDGYYRQQHLAYREIAAAILDQGLF